ncbi:MAG TPA: sigma-54 dependent transcriptional regulator [Nitrospiria bacterium]|jgi:DNA-binding NtrC family response regulator
MNAIKILIVDDEINIRNALATILEKSGYDVLAVENGEKAVLHLSNSIFDVVIVDLKMPGMNGMEVLQWIKSQKIDSEVIVMTAYGTVESAVEAMREGAYDYLSKPLERDRLPITIEKAVEKRKLSQENKTLKERLNIKGKIEQIIGQSLEMKKVYEMIEILSGNDVTVLISGESGTGKELVARALHQNSPRANGPFITLNCGALPESLFESELFGYEKGAFTGANINKPGRFELAHKGTFFLDEIGEMNLKNQVDFLRVLETKEFRRLGGTKQIHIDIRMIAATNRDLQKEVEAGRFREDLYYRLNVIPIHLPPLRDHREDIPLLMEVFLKEFSKIHQKNFRGFSSEALQLMTNYHWPGNVRELKNMVERLVVLVKEETILPEHLSPEIQGTKLDNKKSVLTFPKTLRDMEKETITRVLKEITHHREKAAKILGISPRALHYKIKEYEIEL